MAKLRRLAVAGYSHERSSDAALDGHVGIDHFHVLRGPRVLESVMGRGIGDAGERLGVEVVPGVVAFGYPSATADDEVYSRFRAKMLESSRAAGPIDAVFL